MDIDIFWPHQSVMVGEGGGGVWRINHRLRIPQSQ